MDITEWVRYDDLYEVNRMGELKQRADKGKQAQFNNETIWA